ncbi:hypothetical protein FOA52_006253 [Chlamydomonas sp. UWO 241]|nr:hypothetical protein FOA52_006253 [Chlamydomonas sp. UWO 241]
MGAAHPVHGLAGPAEGVACSELLPGDGGAAGSGMPDRMAARMGNGAEVSHSGAAPAAAAAAHYQPRHLVLLVNGFNSRASHWVNMHAHLSGELGPSVLVHVSTVNQGERTKEGVDVCGERFANEVRSIVAAHPSLTHITVVGHSMGGLICRHALGLLFDPAANTIAGLAPAVYVSLATPHHGLTRADTHAQVPIITWGGSVWGVGGLLSTALSAATLQIGRALCTTTVQFFALDADHHGDAAAAAPAASAVASAAFPVAAAASVAAAAAVGASNPGAEQAGSAGGGPAEGGGAGAGGAQSSDAEESDFVAAASEGAGAAARNSNGDGGTAAPRAPLMVRLCVDDAASGSHCFSALASFRARVAYSNVSGDQWVLWANGAISRTSELPALSARELAQGAGVVHEHDEHGMDTHEQAAEHDDDAAPGARAWNDHDRVEFIVARLQRLRWRRIAVCFQGDSMLGGIPHHRIQARSATRTRGADGVKAHLTQLLAGYLLEEEGAMGGGGGGDSAAAAASAGDGEAVLVPRRAADHVLSILVAAATRLVAYGGGRGDTDAAVAVAAAVEKMADAAKDGISLPVRLATDLVRLVHAISKRAQLAGGGVVSVLLLNAKPAVGGIGVEPRVGGVLRVLFTVASDAVADTVVRWRHALRRCVDPSTAVFDVLSDREEARHQALWPAFVAAKAAGKRAQFHRARLVVDGELVAAPAC